jgi:hypothetical protein
MSAKDVKFSVEARAKEATPYHDDVLIDQPAEALKDV